MRKTRVGTRNQAEKVTAPKPPREAPNILTTELHLDLLLSAATTTTTTSTMVITKDIYLPTEEELTVQEIHISTPALRAAAFHLGKACEAENNEFMLCRKEEKDPRKCIEDGKAVTACSLNFFRKLKKSCLEEFSQYSNCLDKSSRDMEYKFCRNTQAIYDKCVLDNLGMERPEFGYFCEPKIVDSKRPRPIEERPIFPEAPEPLPETPVRGEARYGTRRYWFQ